jgi:RNA polymerase sigma-70 factor (ECF subfamily)
MAAIEQRIGSQDEQARSPSAASHELERLYRRHHGSVRAICLAVLRDRNEVDDAVQQVFLSALRSLQSGVVPRDPGAWLATIARRHCWARARERTTAPLAVDVADAGAQDPATAAVQRAELTEAWRTIAGLPERQREALLLREIRGLGYDELADRLEVSAPSLRSLLLRARRTL